MIPSEAGEEADPRRLARPSLAWTSSIERLGRLRSRRSRSLGSRLVLPSTPYCWLSSLSRDTSNALSPTGYRRTLRRERSASSPSLFRFSPRGALSGTRPPPPPGRTTSMHRNPRQVQARNDHEILQGQERLRKPIFCRRSGWMLGRYGFSGWVGDGEAGRGVPALVLLVCVAPRARWRTRRASAPTAPPACFSERVRAPLTASRRPCMLPSRLLGQTCHSVIGCRLSPDQKRALVSLVRENVPGARSLSIGEREGARLPSLPTMGRGRHGG